MVKLRLVRTGKSHDPHFRIVATDSRKARKGAYLEKIGYYNPRTQPPTVVYDKDILKKWMDRGAQMTDTVHDIFVREKIIKQNIHREKRIKLVIKASKQTREEKDKKEEKPASSPAEAAPEEKKPEEMKTEETAPIKPADEKASEPTASKPDDTSETKAQPDSNISSEPPAK